MDTNTSRTDASSQEIGSHAGHSWPWIPDKPSHPLSEVVKSDDEIDTVYPLNRTVGQDSKKYAVAGNSRGERFGTFVSKAGASITPIAIVGIAGWHEKENIADMIQFGGGMMVVFIILVAITLGICGVTLGLIPGALIKDRAEIARCRAHGALPVGENENLTGIANLVDENATGADDVLWDMWEDLTELADEAARARQNAGPAQLTVYNDNLAAMAKRIELVIEQRQTPEVDAQNALVELESHSDTEMAALLAERLADKNQMWDRIAPVNKTGYSDDKVN